MVRESPPPITSHNFRERIEMSNLTTAIQAAPTKTLVTFYNIHSGRKAIKKFADRATAEKRVAALIADNAELEVVLLDGLDARGELAADAKVVEAQAPKKAPKKAPSQPADPESTAAKISAGVARSWADPDVHAKRTTRNGVTVNDQQYKSVREAFEDLGLPMSRHISFRLVLKAEGKVTDGEGRVWVLI